MKKLLLISLVTTLVTLNAHSIETRHHIPLIAEDQGVDIPKIGSSLFDKVFSKVNADGVSEYHLPFPLKNLMSHMSSHEKRSIVHTMLPFSRSLQRPGGLDYEPLLNPRLVFTLKGSEISKERAKLFIGYVKKVDQLEVISYNDEAGRFEYQLVKDYSKKPKVFYVNRGKCLSCHQGQAPIFSVPGWQDTNSGVLGRLVGAKIGLHNATTLEGKRQAAIKLFGNIPSSDQVGNFDALVREANEVALDERIWLVGCGENKECRLGLLLSTLAPNSEETRKYFEISKSTILSSKLASQNTYSSFLPSVNMDANRIIKKYQDTGSGNRFENTANNPEAISELIGNIYKLTGRDNPANRRQQSFTKDMLLPRSLSGFTHEDRQIIREELPNVERDLVELYNSNSDLFDADAINKPYVMRTLLRKAGSSRSAIYDRILSKKTPKKALFTGPTIPVFKTKELNIFARYCHECHGVGLDFPPQFLVGSEKEVTTKIKHIRTRIDFKLKNNLMPPSQDERRLMMESGDRELLLKYISTL